MPKKPSRKPVSGLAAGHVNRIGIRYPDGVKEVIMARASEGMINPHTFMPERRVFIDSMSMYRVDYVINLSTGEIIKSRFNDITDIPNFDGIEPSLHARYWRSINYES